MASTSTMPATDAIVTIKVNFDGQTKRCKLPLRDMGASTLEDKVWNSRSIMAASFYVLNANILPSCVRPSRSRRPAFSS